MEDGRFIFVRFILEVARLQRRLFELHERAFGKSRGRLAAVGGGNEVLVSDAPLVDHDLRVANDLFAGFDERGQQFAGQRREGMCGCLGECPQVDAGPPTKHVSELLLEDFRREALFSAMRIVD